MRLVRFSKSGGSAENGVLTGDKVVPIAALAPDAPQDMKALIADWDAQAPKLAGAEAHPAAVALADVTLEAPVPDPEKIMAIGLNYLDHIEETGMPTPEQQLWFAKMSNAVNAPNGDIELPKVSDQLDWEVEMVAIIGKGGRHISAADAPDHVFGYAVGNDVSVRDWQMKTPQWVMGKSFDTHAPFGPAIVTADEVGDPHRLDITCKVNGETRQSSNTRHLLFNVWAQVEELSRVMTLKPGDLIFTGTPGGVGLAMKPPVFLKEGDVVTCEIEDLGTITNKVVAEV
ncbi:MAG TPA: 5-carboxymethyl-2-hydroxymuconate isomerase [Maritimibacter sp.]|nr:5-carboxymethyl-2-hydroxymuconate isomerase [Maritimibacter sp.]